MAKEKNLENLKRRAFELCLAIYRVTSIFPFGEPLAIKLRKTSCDIIVSLAKKDIRDTILKTEEIKIYLEVAKAQNWLNPMNLDLLKSAYLLLVDTLLEIREPDKIKDQKVAKKDDNSLVAQDIKEERLVFGEALKRQDKLLDYFKKNKKAGISDLSKLFGSVSERTIRNDLTLLSERKIIKKVGDRRGTHYILVE
ncbi:MAG: DeoR family transcriptional regulator [Candidatus Portnoybacteria bacterium]|nr:DeoR family transcriptional regulator [Candidatus Portnoybacteria bacterium]